MNTESENTSCQTVKEIIWILNTTIPLIWIVIGTITNVLSIIVFGRKQMKQNSTFFYLALMTYSDLIGKVRDFLCEFLNNTLSRVRSPFIPD